MTGTAMGRPLAEYRLQKLLVVFPGLIAYELQELPKERQIHPQPSSLCDPFANKPIVKLIDQTLNHSWRESA
ncbi:hypothetical protein [Synechococcus sp. CBW1107]|uniref:hypothetical protein n=1 Tax=Synechococcus sp. CBW1107 TaxID=2789857 RepID=UPI002AD386B5|nr:hypothetical protein [Synechococcus sp. CBW1107]